MKSRNDILRIPPLRSPNYNAGGCTLVPSDVQNYRNGMSSPPELWLVRHGETEWSLSGAHTSRTDLALTAEGERRAAEVGKSLRDHKFALVLSSPLRRAVETARLAGFSPEISNDLHEWDYGDYEGRTTPEIQKQAPGWSIWTGTPPGGESADQVAARADAVIARALSADGDVLLFSHGHMLRVFAARWLKLEPQAGRYFVLGTGSVSVLGYERDAHVIRTWNTEA
jgi:broad specificity phosphatase PhoE